MASIFRKAKDNLHNGWILGALMGIGIIFGAEIFSFILLNIPSSFLIFGKFSAQILTIVLFAIIGYFVDRF